MVNQWKLELKRFIPKVPVARSAGQSNADSGNEIGRIPKLFTANFQTRRTVDTLLKQKLGKKEKFRFCIFNLSRENNLIRSIVLRMCESSQEWPDWKQHFKRFRCAIKFNAKGEVLQINALIYTMDKEAEQIFMRLFSVKTSHSISHESNCAWNCGKWKLLSRL